MAINYPNGRPFREEASSPGRVRSVNTIYGNRGMSLEDEINESNRYYLEHGIAVIHKKPVPIQIVDVSYPKRSAAVIREAYFKQASTTDYNGVYNGRYIDFEAKETKNRASFPLSNFHGHQVEHMRACMKQDGVCFTIVRFVASSELFLMPASVLFEYWDNRERGRKSIPKSVIEERGIGLSYGIEPRIPYLEGVDSLISDCKSNTYQGGYDGRK